MFFYFLRKWCGTFFSKRSSGLNCDPPFLLKWRACVAHAYSVMNHFIKTIRYHPFILGVITLEIKCTHWTSRDT